jgi:hypothetical protein
MRSAAIVISSRSDFDLLVLRRLQKALRRAQKENARGERAFSTWG